MFIFLTFILFGVVLRGEPLDYQESSEDSEPGSSAFGEQYVAQSPELHDPKFTKKVSQIMGSNEGANDMLANAVKETFGKDNPIEAMKKIHTKVPDHIEDPKLAEALLGHNTKKEVHFESSVADSDELLSAPTSTTKSAFGNGKDGPKSAGGTTTKAALTMEEIKKAGGKVEGEQSVAGQDQKDMTPHGFTLDMNEVSVSSTLANLNELQIWGLAVFFGVLIPMILISVFVSPKLNSSEPALPFKYADLP